MSFRLPLPRLHASPPVPPLGAPHPRRRARRTARALRALALGALALAAAPTLGAQPARAPSRGACRPVVTHRLLDPPPRDTQVVAEGRSQIALHGDAITALGGHVAAYHPPRGARPAARLAEGAPALLGVRWRPDGHTQLLPMPPLADSVVEAWAAPRGRGLDVVLSALPRATSAAAPLRPADALALWSARWERGRWSRPTPIPLPDGVFPLPARGGRATLASHGDAHLLALGATTARGPGVLRVEGRDGRWRTVLLPLRTPFVAAYLAATWTRRTGFAIAMIGTWSSADSLQQSVPYLAREREGWRAHRVDGAPADVPSHLLHLTPVGDRLWLTTSAESAQGPFLTLPHVAVADLASSARPRLVAVGTEPARDVLATPGPRGALLVWIDVPDGDQPSGRGATLEGWLVQRDPRAPGGIGARRVLALRSPFAQPLAGAVAAPTARHVERAESWLFGILAGPGVATRNAVLAVEVACAP